MSIVGVILLGSVLVWFKRELDSKFSFRLSNDLGKTLRYIPLGFLELSVAEKDTIGVDHLGVLVYSFLASVLLLDILHLLSLLFHLGEMCSIGIIGFSVLVRVHLFILVVFDQLWLLLFKIAEPVHNLDGSLLDEFSVTLS